MVNTYAPPAGNPWDTTSFTDTLGQDGLKPPVDPYAGILSNIQTSEPPTQPVMTPPPATKPITSFLLPDDAGMRVWEGMRQEVPDVPTGWGFLKKATGDLTDIAGNTLGKFADVLQWPSDRLEQVIGMAYFHNIPDLATRWDMASMTYETLGFGKGELRRQAMQVATTGTDAEISDFIEKHEGGVSQMLFSFGLDPLNLLGVPGLGYAAKGLRGIKGLEQFGSVEKISTYLDALNVGGSALADRVGAGILGGAIPGIRPVSEYLAKGMRQVEEGIGIGGKRVGIGGKSYIQRTVEKQQNVLETAFDEAEYGRMEVNQRLRPGGRFRNLWRDTPEATEANIIGDGMLSMRLMGQSVTTIDEARAYMQALATGDYAALGKFASFHEIDPRMHSYINAVSQEVTYSKFDVTKMKAFEADFNDMESMRPLLGAHLDPAIIKTPEELREAWTATLFLEFDKLIVPAAAHWVGKGGEIIRDGGGKLWFRPIAGKENQERDAIDKLYSAYKKVLGMGYLNTPAFVTKNIANNIITSSVDGYMFKRYVKDQEIIDAGENVRDFRAITKDRGSITDALGLSKEGKWYRSLTPFISAASWADQGTRRTIFFKQSQRTKAMAWNWRDEGGVLSRLPDVGIEANTLRALTDKTLATGGNVREIDALKKEVRAGAVSLDPSTYLKQAMEEKGWQGQNLNLVYEDSFGSGVRGKMVDGLTGSPLVKPGGPAWGKYTGQIADEFDRLPRPDRGYTRMYRWDGPRGGEVAAMPGAFPEGARGQWFGLNPSVARDEAEAAAFAHGDKVPTPFGHWYYVDVPNADATMAEASKRARDIHGGNQGELGGYEFVLPKELAAKKIELLPELHNAPLVTPKPYHEVYDGLRGDGLQLHVDYHDADPTTLLGDVVRNPTTAQKRIIATAKIRSERDRVSNLIVRRMAAQGYERTDLDAMADLLVKVEQDKQAARKVFFDAVDSTKDRKVNLAADRAFTRSIQTSQESLWNEGHSILSRHPGAKGIGDAWDALWKIDGATEAAVTAHRRETWAKVAKIEGRGNDIPKMEAALGKRAAIVKNRIAKHGATDELSAELADVQKGFQDIADLKTGADPMRVNAELKVLHETHDTLRDQQWTKAIDDMHGAFGVPQHPIPRAVPEMGMPDIQGGSQEFLRFRDSVFSRASELARDASHQSSFALTKEQAGAIVKYLDELKPIARDVKYVAQQSGRAATDYIMHNYDHRMGIDDATKYIFPYMFWPSRTLYRWGQRTLQQPAATAMWAKALNWSNGADIPDRLKGKIKIPLPFMPEWMGGGIYVDPLNVLFPYTHQMRQNDQLDNPDTPIWQRVSEAMGNVGLGLHPYITLPLAMASGPGTRAEYIGYQMHGGPWFSPGTDAQRAISHFLMGGADGNWKDQLDADTQTTLMLGGAFPEPQIRKMLGLTDSDHWDEYRIDRMIANEVAIGGATAEEGLRAIKARSGQLWETARSKAASERGLAALSSWAFGVGGTLYTQGEEIQRGLQQMYALAREQDRKSKDKSDATVRGFFQAFPEYKVRQVATAWYSGRPAQGAEVDTELYYQDKAKVASKYDSQIAYYNQFKRFGLYGTELSALYDARSAAYDQLDKTYPLRKTDPSVYRAPHDRALMLLREQWNKISAPTYTAEKAAQKVFLSKLMGNGMGQTSYLYTQEADRLLADYAARAAADPVHQDAVYKERDRKVNDLTTQAMMSVSATDFLNFIATTKQSPTEAQGEAVKSRDALRTLFRTTQDNWPSVFAANPSLVNAYGNNPDPRLAGQLDALWNGYYALPPQSLDRQDYIDMNLPAFNDLRAQMGLTPLTSGTPVYQNSSMDQNADPVAAILAKMDLEAQQ